MDAWADIATTTIIIKVIGDKGKRPNLFAKNEKAMFIIKAWKE